MSGVFWFIVGGFVISSVVLVLSRDAAATPHQLKPEQLPKNKRAWLLVLQDGVRRAYWVKRDPRGQGLIYGSILLPYDFLEPLPLGGFVLADSFEFPADSDMSQTGELPPHAVVRVSQLSFLSYWSQFDRARRNISAAALFATNDASGVLRIVGFMVAIFLLVSIWFRLGSLGTRVDKLTATPVPTPLTLVLPTQER